MPAHNLDYYCYISPHLKIVQDKETFIYMCFHILLSSQTSFTTYKTHQRKLPLEPFSLALLYN